MQDDSTELSLEFRVGQQVHSVNDPRRIEMVKYVGPIKGHVGEWVGMNWDTEEAKHDGYWRSQASGSAVRWRIGRDRSVAWDGDEDEPRTNRQ